MSYLTNPYRYVQPPVELCQESGIDTVAMNPSSPSPVGNKFGYRMDASFVALGKTISSLTFYLNNGGSATGNISAYIGVSGATTDMGSVDVSTIGTHTSGGHPVTFEDSSHEVLVNDVFWMANDAGRSGNCNAYWVGDGVSSSPIANTTVMFGQTGVPLDPPPVQTGSDLKAVKVCITYS